MSNLLVVDDEEMFLVQVRETLQLDGYHVVTARDGREALQRLQEDNYDLVISDLRMPEMGGMELLCEIVDHFSHLPVIIMSGQGTIELAVSAMKKGAADFLVKPFSDDHLSVVVKKALHVRNIEEENRALRDQMRKRVSFHGLIGKNYQMQHIYETLSIISPSNSTVLILGETGTGKDLMAHAIHYNSPRRGKPFVKVDCGALSESLLESELFGHEKGAFTHAYQQRIGRFEYANGGTIFVDEIGEIPPRLQAKLLRVLEEKKIERVGSNRTLDVDVRIIAATNRDLDKDIQSGKFRSDLFYRLNVIQIKIPPLRERVDDIPFLVNHFIEKYGEKNGIKIQRVSQEVLQALMKYQWLGNVRELEHVIEKTLLLQKGDVIESVDLPKDRELSECRSRNTYLEMLFKEAKGMIVEEFEREYFSHLLECTGGNISSASKKSGLDYKSFYEKMKRYGINPHDFKQSR